MAIVALSASEDRRWSGSRRNGWITLIGELPHWRAPPALLSAAVITACAVLIVDLGVAGQASVHTTLNLPGLSSMPCMAVLAAMPLLFASSALVLIRRRRAR